MPTGLENALRECALAAGASKIGFADMGTLSPDVRHGLPVGVSIAVALTPSIVDEIITGPTADYEAEYHRVNALLDEIGGKCADFLRERGYQAPFTPAPDLAIDRPTLSTVLPYKTVATLAGMGWIGKCALLITEEYGSAVRLTTVLTDAPLTTSEPVTESRCGECVICTQVCPGSAPSGDTWTPGAARESLYDPFACLKTAMTVTEKAGLSTRTICGRCISACPWTRRYVSK